MILKAYLLVFASKSLDVNFREVEEPMRKGIRKIPGSKPAVNVNCAKGCSKHEEMNNCGSLCEPSCSNQFPDCGSGPSVPPSCGPRPMRGCRCQSGFFRKDNGKCSKKFLCLVGVGELASGAKIFGGASIDSQAAGVQAGLTFPKIPGLNSPIFGISILPTASSNNTWDVFNNLFPRILSNDNDSLSSDGNRNGNTSIGQNQQGTTTTSSSNQIETSTTPSSNQNETTTTPSSNQSSTTTQRSTTTQSSSTTQRSTTTQSSSTTQSSVSSFIKRALTSMLPNINSLVPTLRNLTGNITLPSIQGPPSLDSLPQIPGLSDAIAEAREHVRIALNATGDFVDGIETALQQALQSNNPTEAVRTLVNTILNAYLVVAQNCPMIVVGTRVLREGIRLAGEVARSARNIVFGTQ
ncbi:hypothetical protein KQX54_002878 [Cotesia glomerata]|uniref:TIL domain-containing protein n=1 Tax=Cotesia glomerata TaxID=32391 RepID=A0AAV7IHG0_COTGL|nr:hypothetical protein KQX54_002878 [Cotesia glomerata]